MSKINTITGVQFDMLNPRANDIHIEDIAHALSMLCRFNGHCKEFYCVAEHCVYVSYEIGQDLALVGLLHDAAEAYLGDVPTPLKKQLSVFLDFERKLEQAVGQRFGIDPMAFHDAPLKNADEQLFADEWVMLMQGECPSDKTPKPRFTKPLSQTDAKHLFLDRFRELTG